MPKDDKMTRDIRNTLKKTFGATGRYATGTAKLFLASSELYFKEAMPAPVAMFETNKDILIEFWRTLRNPSEAANKYGSRITQMESYKELKKFANNALDDIKSGKLYDKDRDRSSFGMEIDNLMDDFGGFDMTGFDENGDWSEDNIDFDELDTQIKIAEAQESGEANRTEATIDAIGTGTEAIVRNQQAIASNELRIGMKEHSQLMSAMQNMITQQATGVELQAKSINALLDVTREAHNQMLEQFNRTNEILTEIRDYVKPVEDTRRDYDYGNQPFGYNGELNIKEYVKNVTKNVKDKFLFGGGLSTFTGGFSIAQVLDSIQDNPLQLITDLIVPRLIPNGTKEQMKRTNRNIGSFLPALFTKMADRGKRFERGESEDWKDALMGIFGVEQRSRSYISTEREDYLKAAKFTDKTTRAIEEVIPTLLAKIDSSLTGNPLMIYDYKQGKFVKATSIIASGEYDVKDLAGKGGETTWKMMQRAGAYKFRTTEDSDQFKSYMYDFLQKMAEESRFINKNMSKEELIKMMPSVKDVTSAEVERYGGSQKWSNDIKRDQYADMILAILRKIDPSDLQEMSRNMIDARVMRDRATHDINRNNEDTGRGAAWSGLLDPKLQEAITTATRKQYGGLTEDDIKRITETKKSELSKAHGITNTNSILGDILTTLHGGIITYTYHMGRIKDSDISSGNTVISKQVQESLDRLEMYRKKEEDRLEEIRKKEEEKKNKLKQEMDEYNKTVTNMNRAPNEMYADAMGLMDLEAVQEGITLEEYSPDDPKLKEIKEKKDKYQNYGKLLNSQIDKITEKGKKFSSVGEKFRQITKVPFELFNKGMQLADAFMLKALYGDDINLNNYELWQGKDGEPFLLKTVTDALNVHFKNAKNWFVDEIGDPLKNYFFGKEDGLFPKIKAAAYEMFGVEEKKQKIKDTVNEYKNKALDKIRGVKNEETGLYEGGWFSKQFNDMNKTKDDIKSTMFDSIKGGVDRLLYGDLVADKGKINTYDFDEQGNMITGKAYSGVIGRLKQGFDGIHDMLFGPDDNPDEDSRNKFKYVKNELSNAFPNMVVGAGAGILASLFLPGGPLLGAVIGSTLGLVKGSDGLKQFLFGDAIEEDDTYIDPFTGKKEVRLGPDGKPIKKKTRKGNLISKDVYEGFKKFAPKVTVGAILGTVAGGLGLLPLGLGSTAGMVVGSMAGMIGASDQMKKLIFGKEGDDDSGLISKNFRKSVIDWGKKNLPTTMLGALSGGAAWSLISSVGLIPGLAMLPGGPILGFLGASVGLANGDNIKDFFFGTEEEIKDPETGKVKTQRQGGIFGKAFDTVRDKIMTPIAKSFNFAGEKTKEWFQENIIGSMKRTMKPMQDALIDAGKQIEHAMKNIGNGIVEALFGKLDDANSPRYKFHKFWNDKIMGKLKELPNKIFGAIGKAIGFVLSSPFKAAEFIFTGKIGGKTLEQRKVEKNFKKRHKQEMKKGQYDYLADEDSEWGILNLANRAKRKFTNAFTTYSPDAMALIRSGKSLNELEDTGEFEYFGDKANSVRKEMYEYFGRQEDEENRHKTRSAKQKMLHDLEGRVNKRQTLGLLPGQAVKGYMTEQDYMRGLGFDDRIVNTEWAKKNISIDTFLQEGGAPDIKAYKAWVTGKIDDEKKKFDKKRKRKARDAKWQQDEERWALNALNRRRAHKGLPPLQNLKDYDEATDIITKNYEGQTADNPDAILDENGHVIHEVDANGNYTGLIKTKKKHWYDDIAKQFKADKIGPNRNQSWMDSFTGYLDEYGSDKSFMERFDTTPKEKQEQTTDSISTVEEPQIPTVNTADPTMPKAVPVKLIESQLDAISNSNNQSNVKETTTKNETSAPTNNEIAELPQKAKEAVHNNGTDNTSEIVNSILPPTVAEQNRKVKERLANRSMNKAQMSEEAKRAAKQQQDEEARKEQKEVEQFAKGVNIEDRSNENTSDPIKANDTTDKNIANAKTKREQEGIIEAAKGNATRRQMPMMEKDEKDKESWLDKILGFLPKVGGILAAIFGGITGLLSLVGGIGAAIGALTSGAVDKAMHGVEVLAHGFLKRFGFSTMKGATFEDIGKVFTNSKVAREMSEDAAEASAKSITKRAARKNKMTAKGLNRAARWADFFEAAGKAAKGDKAGLAKMAEDASERGFFGGLGQRARQGLGKVTGTGIGKIGAGLSKLGSNIANSGFAKATGAAFRGEKMFSAGLRNQAEAYGKYSKTGVKAGENVGKVFKTVKDSFAKTLEKFFNLNIIKNTKFGKFGNKVANAILNGSFWTKVQEKFLTLGGKEAAARVSLKSLHVVPVLTLGFAIADFTIGLSKAKEYFGVFAGDVTEGMRFTAGVVNCLEGLIAAIPVPPVVPLLVSVALSFFTGEIAQAVYNAIASDDAKEELQKNQNALQKATDEYNKTHENKLTAGEYAKNYNKDGTENNTTVWHKIKTFLFGDKNKENKTAANVTNKNSSMRYSTDGALVGKGTGISESSWGTGGKHAKELCGLDCGNGIGINSAAREEKKEEIIKEVNSRLHDITGKKRKQTDGIKLSIVDSTEKEEAKKEKEERKEATRKKLNIKKPTIFKNNTSNKTTKKTSLKDKISSAFNKLTSFGSGSSLSNNDWGAGNKITPISQHSAQYNHNNRLMADAGCGPTSAAMVASAYGVKLNPEQISNDSFAAGMRANDGGMNPKYFSQMADKYGSGFGMKQGPVDGQKIQTNLSAGRPIVMMGKGGPYGPTTHYMVAEGLTDNGKVKMIDPNNGSRKTVTGNNLIKNSTASVYSYGTGAGIKEPQHSKIDSAFRYHRNIMDSWGKGTNTNTTMLDNSADNTTTDSSADINIIQQTSFSLITRNGRKGIKYIVLHYTTQTSSKKGAARSVCSMWANKGTKGSADYVVDDAEIVQYNPDPSKHSTWHCGGGLQYSGKKPTSRAGQYHGKCTNSNSIGIEMSSNNSTGRYENDVSPNAHWYLTPATIANAARLTKYLMKKYNVPIENVIMHHDVTGKICPQPWCCNEAALSNFQQFKQQVMGASVGNIGGTTIDSSGTSGITGTIGTVKKTSAKGEQMLDSISTLFKKISNPFNNLINKLLNTEDEISTESNVSSESDGTTTGSTGGIPSVTGTQGSKEDNAKYIYKFMKSLNVPDDHIAAVLSNWTAESGIDPTGVETIYAPKYKMSEQKMKAMADPNAFSLNVMFPKYARSGISIHKSAYKGDDGKYYPGIGLGGFTGPAVSGLLRKSQEINKPWYDLETQLRYMTDPSGSTYKRGKYAGRDWIDNIFIPQKFSSPSQGAAWFEKNWEGSTFKQAEHMRTAQEWYNKIQSGVWGSGEGIDTKDDTKDIEREIANVKPHEIDNRTGNKQIPETDTNWTPGWGAGNKIKEKINKSNIIKKRDTKQDNPDTIIENDLGAQSLLDDDYNTPKGKQAAFGRGRGIWGKGFTDTIISKANNVSNAAGNSQVKAAVQAIMNEYRSSDWTKTTTGGYGIKRTNMGYLGTRYHAGIDLCFASNGATGRAVKSFTSGTVHLVKSNPNGRGYYIIIKDNNGYYHFYQHLNKLPSLQPGTAVKIGDTVGGYGSSGFSKGNHMHYEVRPPSVVNQPGGVTGTDPNHKGFILSEDELRRYTVNPYKYLQQYMNGNIDPSMIGGGDGSTSAEGGTTTDSEGVSGTEGNVNEPSGLKFLSAVGTMFSKFASPLDNLINAIMNQGTSSSEDSSTSDSSTSSSSSSGTPVMGKYEESQEGVARGAYDWMKQLGVPDIHIAGMLSNWNHESHLDPTAVEGDYKYFPDEYYRVGPKKQAAFADLNSYTKKVMALHHTTSSFYQAKKSQGGDDNWYAGIGLPQFTGINGYKLVNYAKSIGKPWYNLETQLRYFTEPGQYYDGFKPGANAVEKWKSQKFSTPEEAAAYYYSHWEMPGKTIDNAHKKNASKWYAKAQEWSNGGTSGLATGSTTGSTETSNTSTDSSNNNSSSSLITDMAKNITGLGKGKGISDYSFGKGVNEDVMDTIANNPIVDINSEFGAGTGTASYNVEAVTNKIKDINKSLKKTNTVTDVNTGFDNVSKLARRNATTVDKKDDTTAQILAFLTENIGTLIQYVSTIADRMPVQQKTTDVQKNLSSNKYSKLPTANANNMYAPTPTGNDSEDVGLRIMNSLTSK